MADAIEQLHDLFSYEEASGTLLRKQTGCKAGTRDERGYVRVLIGGKKYRAHRVIWAMVYGKWPSGDIDHINGDRSDNRLQNLRDVPHNVNMQNQKRARSDNGCKFLGVTWHKQPGKWRARITLDGRQVHLGHFETPQLAHAAYVQAKRAIHAGGTL